MRNLDNLRKAGLNELVVFAITYVNGYDPDEGVDCDVMVTDQAVYDRFAETMNNDKHSPHCDMCGHRVKYICWVANLRSNEVFYVGRECANSINTLQEQDYKGLSKRLAERARMRKAEKEAKAKYGEELITWGLSEQGFARDITDKAVRYGNLSEKQEEALKKAFEYSKAKVDIIKAKVESGAVVTAGRQELTGVVMKSERHSTQYGDVTKWLVKLPNECKLWGNLPDGAGCKEDFPAGTPVTFTATVEVSQKDPTFGFFKIMKNLKKVG